MEERTPPPYDTSPEALERDCEVEFVKGSGPGGQHRNKRETGVRVVHRPSGIVVVATERRSQPQNLDNALARLVARLEELNHVPEPRVPTRVPRAKKAARVQAKRYRGAIKAARRPPDPE